MSESEAEEAGLRLAKREEAICRKNCESHRWRPDLAPHLELVVERVVGVVPALIVRVVAIGCARMFAGGGFMVVTGKGCMVVARTGLMLVAGSGCMVVVRWV